MMKGRKVTVLSFWLSPQGTHLGRFPVEHSTMFKDSGNAFH